MSEEGEQNERRKTFTPDEIDAITEQILDKIYADIGKSVVKKVLWVGGAILFAAFAWLVELDINPLRRRRSMENKIMKLFLSKIVLKV